jgi:hypothetical protein
MVSTPTCSHSIEFIFFRVLIHGSLIRGRKPLRVQNPDLVCVLLLILWDPWKGPVSPLVFHFNTIVRDFVGDQSGLIPFNRTGSQEIHAPGSREIHVTVTRSLGCSLE